jgi:outer membrane protein assembly factor BamB
MKPFKWLPAGVFLLAATLSADDWPVFRGNALQDGVSADKLPEQIVELWKFSAGDSIEGTPAIVDGVVYFGSMDKYLYAVDLKSGKAQWKYSGGPFKAPAGVHQGRVYIGDLDGAFHCVDAAKGAALWKFTTESEITSGASFAGDRVLFGCGDESLYCLDAEGKKVWQFKVPGGPVMATPPVADGRTFVSGCDSKLHFVDVKTGMEMASIDLEGQTGATPAVHGDSLYVGTMSNQVLAIDLKAKKVTWGFESARGQPFFASAAVTDKLVVAGGRDKRVYALDRATGKQVWSFVTENRIESSPVIVGNRVYVGSLDENLYVIDLEKGTQLQKIKLDGPIQGSPAVSNGRLVIGTDKGTLYCFGAKE